MSEIKTNKISPRKGTTTTIGDSGDTISLPSGTSLNIQGTYSGINSISWDTTAKTTNFTAETNKGYFINTTSGEVTITLPATPVAGSFIGIKDYALTAQTNNILIAPNGNKIQGTTNTYRILTQGGAVNLVYVDSTQGWLTYDAAQASDIAEGPAYIVATGGTITTCGNDKIHTFTGPGTFCVSCAGNPAGSNSVNYMVVAGGGGGGAGTGPRSGGAGGAGGYRASGYGPAPLQGTALPVTVTGYPITVGAGGAGNPSPADNNVPGVSGSSSIFSTITSAGGGGGDDSAGGCGVGQNGGSGGGATRCGTAGTGNTPPVSPPQGNNGGPSGGTVLGGGGGGATAAGSPGPNGAGGAGAPNSINGSAVTYSTGGSGGSGAVAACANTGDGGDGGITNPAGPTTPASNGASGGSGIVIIRYQYQ